VIAVTLFRLALGAAVVVAVSRPAFPQPPRGSDPEAAKAQSAAAQAQLTASLNGIAFGQLARREATVAAIRTRADAVGRQAEVRRRVLDLVGGLPEMRGPVVERRFGTVEDDGFRIENVAYESAPGYWVTANV
jgi:hypothetical protein